MLKRSGLLVTSDVLLRHLTFTPQGERGEQGEVGPVGPIGEPVSIVPASVYITFILCIFSSHHFLTILPSSALQGAIGEQGHLGAAGKPGARVRYTH